MSFTFLKHLSVMICACLICAEQTGYSQEFVFQSKRIEFEEGLASRNINCFFEDSRGFVWFGTDEGLNKYDAHRLDLYEDTNGLVSNYISQIAEDQLGRLWLLGDDPNFSGQKVLQIFDPLKGKSLLATEQYTNLPFDLADVVGINSDYSTSHLWVTVENHGVYELQNGEFENIWKPEGELEGVRIQKSLSGQDCLWLFAGNSLVKIGQSSVEIIKKKDVNFFGQPPLGASIDGDIIYTVDLRTTRNLNQTDSTSLELNNERLTLNNENFLVRRRLIAIDPFQKHIWSESANMVHIHDYELNLLTKFPFNSPLFVPPKFLHFTKNGIGWLNVDNGVLMVYLRTPKFRNYLTDIRVFDQNGYSARGIYVEGDTMFSNGLGNSYRTDLNTGEYEPFGPITGFYGLLWDQEAFKRLALLKDTEGNLWYTDEAFRVAKYDRGQKKFTDYTYPDSTIDSLRMRNIDYSVLWAAHFDENNTLWIGRRAGLAYRKAGKDYLENFENYGVFPELRRSGVFDFHENSQGIWIASLTGLYLMTPDGKMIKRYHQQGSEGNKIPYNNIVQVREDEQGFLWLASRGGGIIKLNIKNGEFEQWTTRQGLSDNVVYATYEDDFGYIWASSNNGIMRIRKSDFQISTFLEGDGLNTEEFNTTSHFQAEDGRIFFGSIDGVTVFQPADFLIKPDDSKEIKLSKLQKQKKATGLYENSTSELLDSESIVLKPNELGFNLQFSLMDFKGAEYNSYSYQIEGLDGDWNYISEPSVRVNALPYGSYNLLIRGQSSQGQWSDELNIPLIVIRPFYLRWWFILLLILIVATLVYVIIQNRIKSLKIRQEKLEVEVEKRTEQIRQQAEELKSMDKLKSKFFANVSHELRTPLTLILGPVSGLLKNDVPDKIKSDLLRVERNANNMSNLVEEILDLSKLEAKQLNVNLQSTLTHEFFEVLFTNFLSQAKLKEIKYDYTYKGDQSESLALDQRLVERIITNLLSNAFKFTPSEGQVMLKVDSSQTDLVIEVIDTGVGISEDDQANIFDRFFQTKDTSKNVQGGTGIGLAMSKELSQLLDGNLEVIKSSDKGTTFRLTLPKIITEQYSKVERKLPPNETTNILEEGNTELISKAKLLIVEDNIDMQGYLKELLNDFSYIETAGHGKEGLVKLNQSLPDIIISDMMMPEMDGLEFLDKVRQKPETADIPLLMLTARSAEEDKLSAFTLGVDDYLLKPFSEEELKARLRNLLKNSEVRKTAKGIETTENLSVELEGTNERNFFLDELRNIVENHVHQVDFNVSSVAEKVGLSERQFQRNLKKMTGLTPVVYVKEIRLLMARNYLEKKKFSQVSKVSEAVGFTSTAYFSKLYKKRFGKTPSEYLN